jgi:excisionase family DNA binding protein
MTPATSLEELPLMLTVEEAAAVLRIGRGSAYEGCRTGDIPAVRIGRRVVVPRAGLVRLLGESDPGADPADAEPVIHEVEPHGTPHDPAAGGEALRGGDREHHPHRDHRRSR